MSWPKWKQNWKFKNQNLWKKIMISIKAPNLIHSQLTRTQSQSKSRLSGWKMNWKDEMSLYCSCKLSKTIISWQRRVNPSIKTRSDRATTICMTNQKFKRRMKWLINWLSSYSNWSSSVSKTKNEFKNSKILSTTSKKSFNRVLSNSDRNLDRKLWSLKMLLSSRQLNLKI